MSTSQVRAHQFIGGHAVSSANRVPVEIAGGDLTSYIRDVQRGGVSGSRVIHQFANLSLGIGLTRTFWSRGNTANQPVQTSTVSLEIVSASASDTSAGTGARTVYVEGLDSNFAVKTATATMNGVTAVSLGSGWLRVNFVRVLTAGSSQVNAGTISVQIASGGTIQAQIVGSQGYENHLNYTVPAGKTAYVLQLSFGSMGDTQVQTFSSGNSTKNLPLLSTGFLGFVGLTGATAADLVYHQEQRMFAYRGQTIVRDYGFSLMLPAKSLYQPAVQNLTADSIEFNGDLVILEEDAA